MMYYTTWAFVLLILENGSSVPLAAEPVCSKFVYEEQLLEKMIRMELKVETMENEIKKTEESALNTLNEIKKKDFEIGVRFEDLRNNISEEMLENTKYTESREEVLRNLFEQLRKNLTDDMNTQKNALAESREEMLRPSVAFYAHHVTDTILDVYDEILVFDRTITNEGLGYDTSTGVFTAPVVGLYQFNIHVCAYGGYYSFIGLVLADQVVAKASNYDKDYNTCNSVGAIVRVKPGEKVWVKCTSAASNRKLLEDSLRMNTFSGVLMYK